MREESEETSVWVRRVCPQVQPVTSHYGRYRTDWRECGWLQVWLQGLHHHDNAGLPNERFKGSVDCLVQEMGENGEARSSQRGLNQCMLGSLGSGKGREAGWLGDELGAGRVHEQEKRMESVREAEQQKTSKLRSVDENFMSLLHYLLIKKVKVTPLTLAVKTCSELGLTS